MQIFPNYSRHCRICQIVLLQWKYANICASIFGRGLVTEAAGAVGLLVCTQVILPEFTFCNCSGGSIGGIGGIGGIVVMRLSAGKIVRYCANQGY